MRDQLMEQMGEVIHAQELVEGAIPLAIEAALTLQRVGADRQSELAAATDSLGFFDGAISGTGAIGMMSEVCRSLDEAYALLERYLGNIGFLGAGGTGRPTTFTERTEVLLAKTELRIKELGSGADRFVQRLDEAFERLTGYKREEDDDGDSSS